MLCMYQIVLEADGYLPYLISPEKGLRALVRKVLELAKEPARQCVDEVRQFVLEKINIMAAMLIFKKASA